jgi:hypothetical protein
MPDRPRSHRLAVVLGWIGAAALATGVTLAAVSSIGTGIFGSSAGPMGQDEVATALATATAPADRGSGTSPATPATPPPVSPTPGEAAATDPAVITSPGGTVVVQCSDGLAELLSWSPAQGFWVDSAERGPDDTVEVEFESRGTDVEVEVRCVDGVPDATVIVDD